MTNSHRAIISRLFLYEREEAHEARTFDRGFDGTLLLGGQAAFLAAHDATVRIDELLQEVDIFVIDVLNVILREDVVAHNFVFCIS